MSPSLTLLARSAKCSELDLDGTTLTLFGVGVTSSVPSMPPQCLGDGQEVYLEVRRQVGAVQ